MIQYVSSGHFISSGEWLHPEICTDTYEIICVLKGEVHLFEKDTFYTLLPNEVLLLEPGLVHGGTKSSSQVEFYWLHFLRDQKPAFKYFSPQESYEVKSHMKRLLHITNTPDYPSNTFDAATLWLVSELEYQYRHTGPHLETELSNRICEYIRINSRMPLSVADIAGYFGYTTGYIGKLFKAKYHMKLKSYIESERIKYAKNLLITTTASVKEIACSMGYEDEKNFIKFFSYHEKISPARYRNTFFRTHQNNR